MRSSAQPLLAEDRLARFLEAAARGTPLKDLAAAFGVTYQQGVDLRRSHRGRILAVCAERGLASPFRGPRGATQRSEWIKPGPDPTAQKMRRCLSCGEDFPSTWAGHRVCDACKTTVAWQGGADAAVCETPAALAGRVAP